MNRLYIELSTQKISIRLLDEDENLLLSDDCPLTGETGANGCLLQDASDWWVGLASLVRQAAERNSREMTQVREILLSGNKDGFVLLDRDDLPLYAAFTDSSVTPAEFARQAPQLFENCVKLLSPVAYLRYMLTGIYTREADEYAFNNRGTLPLSLFGSAYDKSFQYFELAKEAAYIMRLKRPVKLI